MTPLDLEAVTLGPASYRSRRERGCASVPTWTLSLCHERVDLGATVYVDDLDESLIVVGFDPDGQALARREEDAWATR